MPQANNTQVMTVEEIKCPFGVVEIEKIIPHRNPFLLVDQVTEFVMGSKISGLKNVSANEPFFLGHFPGRPVMPGVMILEALAQLGAIFAMLAGGDPGRNKLIVFSGADKVRFRRLVVPGDVLKLELYDCKSKFGHWKMQAKASVNGEIAAEAQLMATEVA